MKKRGSALLVVVIIMSIVFFMAAIMINMTIRSSRNTKADYDDVQAYYCAEAGINDGVNYLKSYLVSNPTPNSINETTFNSSNLFGNSKAKYSVTIAKYGDISSSTDITVTVTSTGTYNNSTYIITSQVQFGRTGKKTAWQYTSKASNTVHKKWKG